VNGEDYYVKVFGFLPSSLKGLYSQYVVAWGERKSYCIAIVMVFGYLREYEVEHLQRVLVQD
jgi:hypothetical protein